MLYLFYECMLFVIVRIEDNQRTEENTNEECFLYFVTD